VEGRGEKSKSQLWGRPIVKNRREGRGTAHKLGQLKGETHSLLIVRSKRKQNVSGRNAAKLGRLKLWGTRVWEDRRRKKTKEKRKENLTKGKVE